MRVGSLFSGIGGFDLGLEGAGYEIAWQVENNDYCRRILKKHWPHVPCHYDITTIDWRFIQPVDLVCGGFPCQPFSQAGKRKGKDDDRYLWPEVVRCLAVLRPTWFLGENVPGLLHLGIEQVLADLEALGYQVAVLGIPACAVDAPHIRQRLWIVAYCERQQLRDERRGEVLREAGAVQATEEERQRVRADLGDGSQAVADTSAQRSNGGRWEPEPAVGELVNGVSGRLVRFGGRVVTSAAHRKEKLRALGNAIVPQIAEALGRMILTCTSSGRIG